MPHRTLRPSASRGSRAAILAEVNSAPLTALQRQGRHPEHTQAAAFTSPCPELLRDRPAAQCTPAGRACAPGAAACSSPAPAALRGRPPPRSGLLRGCFQATDRKPRPVLPAAPSAASPSHHQAGQLRQGTATRGRAPGRYHARLGRAARAARTAFKVRTASGPGPGPGQPQGEGS